MPTPSRISTPPPNPWSRKRAIAKIRSQGSGSTTSASTASASARSPAAPLTTDSSLDKDKDTAASGTMPAQLTQQSLAEARVSLIGSLSRYAQGPTQSLISDHNRQMRQVEHDAAMFRSAGASSRDDLGDSLPDRPISLLDYVKTRSTYKEYGRGKKSKPATGSTASAGGPAWLERIEAKSQGLDASAPEFRPTTKGFGDSGQQQSLEESFDSSGDFSDPRISSDWEGVLRFAVTSNREPLYDLLEPTATPEEYSQLLETRYRDLQHKQAEIIALAASGERFPLDPLDTLGVAFEETYGKPWAGAWAVDVGRVSCPPPESMIAKATLHLGKYGRMAPDFTGDQASRVDHIGLEFEFDQGRPWRHKWGSETAPVGSIEWRARQFDQEMAARRHELETLGQSAQIQMELHRQYQVDDTVDAGTHEEDDPTHHSARLLHPIQASTEATGEAAEDSSTDLDAGSGEYNEPQSIDRRASW